MHFLITAGPTREPIDPVRYLSNRSSGKMGYALAGAAAHEDHQVTLISGPTELDIPDNIDFIPVETAVEMYQAAQNYIQKADIAICAAAVADYRPADPTNQKVKKSSDTLTLQLIKNPDILASARTKFKFPGTLVGFAAETENLEHYARQKLTRKQADLIVANDVSRSDIGFDSNENEILLIYPDKTIPLPKDTKHHLALEIIKAALTIHTSKGDRQQN